MIRERHSFKLEFEGLANALVTPCLVSSAWEPGSASPEPQRIEVKSLWDTGASGSVVSKRVVEQLSLQVEGYEKARHVYGEVDKVPIHYVNLVLFNRVQVVGVRALQGEFFGFDVLIGMDIISQGDFVITNSGGVTEFSFRIPSVAKFDFVKEDTIFNRRQADADIRSSSGGSKRRRKKRKK